MQQSLRLIELTTCVMSSYNRPEGSYTPPPAPARPPRLRASKEWKQEHRPLSRNCTWASSAPVESTAQQERPPLRGWSAAAVVWLYFSKRIIIVRWADLSDFLFIFVGKMCVFVSRPMKIVTFLWKNGYSPKRVVDFPLERDTFRNKIMEIVQILTKKVTTTTVNPGNRRGFCV